MRGSKAIDGLVYEDVVPIIGLGSANVLESAALDGADVIFGTIKMWGEIVEHELGYRAEFAKIISLDQGNPKSLTKLRTIYGLDDPSVPKSYRIGGVQ